MKHIPWLYHFISLIGSVVSNRQETWVEPPQITQQLPTKQPHRKTGVAQSRRDARKRRNRK